MNPETTINAFAAENGFDRRTITHRVLANGVMPVRLDGRISFYNPANLRQIMRQDTRKTVRPAGSRPLTSLDFGDGIDTAIERIGKALPQDVAMALDEVGIGAEPKQINRLAIALFLLSAKHLDKIVLDWGFLSVFEPLDDGGPWYPPAIAEVAKRAGVELPS